MGGPTTSILERRALEVHRRSGGLTRPIGVRTIPAGPVGLSVDATDWVVVSIEDDPLFERGAFVAPDAVIERLRRLDAAKVQFDRVFVAHEVPAGTLKSGAPLTPSELERLIPDAAPHPRAEATLRACTRLTSAAAAVTLAPLAIASILPAAAVAAVGSAIALDPALMGVVTATGRAEAGELGAWFLIAAWT